MTMICKIYKMWQRQQCPRLFSLLGILWYHKFITSWTNLFNKNLLTIEFKVIAGQQILKFGTRAGSRKTWPRTISNFLKENCIVFVCWKIQVLTLWLFWYSSVFGRPWSIECTDISWKTYHLVRHLIFSRLFVVKICWP